MKTHKRAFPIRPSILVAGLLVILLAMLLRRTLRETTPPLNPVELRAFNDSAGQMLGRHLAGRFPGGNVLIVAPPGAEPGVGTEEHAALLKGFRTSVAGHFQVVAQVSPKPPAWFREEMRKKLANGEYSERDMVPLLAATTMWYDTRGLADLIRAQPEPVALVVSTAALPEDFPGSPELAASLPPVVLLLAPVLNLDRLLDTGRVEAMVVFKPPGEWTPVDSPETDANKAFESRYLLVHPGNREAVQRQHPGAFR